jgi:Tfp pilus assembly protein PilF
VLALSCGNAVHAQDSLPDCAPAVARLVSLQGQVEIQRAASTAWVAVRRLGAELCAGDRLRTDALSRAALYLQPETVVRLDQNTVVRFNQSTDEIEVEFFAAELAAELRDARSVGAGYFITRFPKKFKVKTPHMNAAVEGTEFMVELSVEATKLTVLEGEVSSQSMVTGDTQLVAAGQSLASGASGAGAIASLVKPKDAVQWVLRYPPISDGSGASRAEELLRAGSVDEAHAEIDSVLRGDPGNSDALALRTIIQVAKNDKAGAQESAGKATAANAANYRAWLALSYAQQAGFELEAALDSAQKARSLQPASALSHARVAELYLSLGDSRHAEEAARAAVAADPGESHAHSILGFVHLADIDTRRALAELLAAVERDSFSALPRLGLGLAKIRDGELKAGREQIEIAVALDPSNSLLRSYIGKAYYEENSRKRDELAAQQFELASQLDPLDPTPLFYNAILEFSRSRPAKALESLERSSSLNDDRAVYRSRQLLDLDLAARNVSLATVYNDLGFDQLGLTTASRSLALDPGSGSAHRFLADIYSTAPRHEIARASELLQAQLRQPLGAPALQTQLANDVQFQNSFFGPSMVGLNEFNPLFLRDDLHFQFFGLLGDDDTYGDQAIVSGLNGPVSFSLGQLATETDGYRPNNDNSLRQYDGFIQAQFGPRTSVQLEAASTERESGDLTSAFDPTFFSTDLRIDEDIDSYRFGLRQVIDASSDLLVSTYYMDRGYREAREVPFSLSTRVDEEGWKVEAQYLKSGESYKLLVGTGSFDWTSSIDVISPFFTIEDDSKPSHLNAYGYIQWATGPGWPLVQLGLSYDDFSSPVGDQTEWNPKFGLLWSLSGGVTLRAAAFRVLERQIGSDQGLEPTQLAGFNQFFRDANGAVSEGGGLAADFAVSDHVSAGLQIGHRDVKVPFVFPDSIFIQSQREDALSGYAYWLPDDRVSVAFEPSYLDFTRGATFDRMRLTELPISLRYFAPSGWRYGITAAWVEQDGAFDSQFDVVPGSDSFWMVDAIVAWRLPNRLGTISLEGTNLLNEEFQFQEIAHGVLHPRYVPEAQVRLRFSLSF